MEKFVIHGGKPLGGEVEISGAKKAAVAVPAGTHLCGGERGVGEHSPNRRVSLCHIRWCRGRGRGWIWGG